MVAPMYTWAKLYLFGICSSIAVTQMCLIIVWTLFQQAESLCIQETYKIKNSARWSQIKDSCQCKGKPRTASMIKTAANFFFYWWYFLHVFFRHVNLFSFMIQCQSKTSLASSICHQCHMFKTCVAFFLTLL